MDATLTQMMDPTWWTGWRMFWAVIIVAAALGLAKSLIKE